MSMKTTLQIIFLQLALLPGAGVMALVDPVPTTLAVPGWMASINVWVNKEGRFRDLCKGALVAPQWVLSTGQCLLDPYRYLDSVSPEIESPYHILIGPNEDVVETDKYYVSDDYSLALFHLVLPSGTAPLAMSGKTANQLLGATISILGKQKSSAVYHSFFNPNVATTVTATCQIGGVDFFLNGAFCFITSPVVGGATVYQTTGTIIDPKSPTAPATALDQAASIDTSGKRLYVDFRKQKSYPCFEDLGSPLLTSNAAGDYEIVGVVSAVGVAAGLSICGMSMYNIFDSNDPVRSFIDKTYASYDFSGSCPAVPKPSVVYTGGSGINLSWKSVKGAIGYKVYYSSNYRQTPITAIDVKGQTSITTELPHSTDFVVEVAAYNEACTGGLSKPLAINVDVH